MAGGLISVLIPTYNRCRALESTLKSLDCQTETGRPFEVIVVDDGSTDETEAFLQQCSFSYPFRSVRQENRGPAAARNLGLKLIQGDTVLFLNDDCTAAPDLVAQHRRYHREFGECAVLGHIEWSPEIVLAPEVKELARRFYFPYHLIEDPADAGFGYFITGNLSVPVRKVTEAGGFDEEFREAAFEDIELGYRLEQLGLRTRYNPHAIAYHLHQLTFDDLCDRHRKVAYWLYVFLRKHPEAKAAYIHQSALHEEFPIKRIECLQVVLSYMSYRGFKQGRADFDHSGTE